MHGAPTPFWLTASSRKSNPVAASAPARYAEPLSERMAHTATEIPDFSRQDGLVTAVAQDAATGEVLMVAHMNHAAFEETLATGTAVYFSRSRGKLWRKGEESGNVQHVLAVYVDCDGDVVLLKVDQAGGACHEGYRSCFFRQVTPQGLKVVAERLFDPSRVYGKQ
jgi:phosphoribosyl-AMP cyclohydrolase